MEDGGIPKDLLYGELELESRPVGSPKLHIRDVCKRDMLATGLTTDNWESLTADRGKWKTMRSQALRAGETKLKSEADAKRAKRKAVAKVAPSGYICRDCGRARCSRIGLNSHRRKMFASTLSHGQQSDDCQLSTQRSDFTLLLFVQVVLALFKSNLKTI